MATGLRALKGRDFFEPRIEQKMSDMTKEGSEFFCVKRYPLDPTGYKDQKVLTPIFFCQNVPGLIKFVEKKRGYHSQTDKIHLFGFDKGGNSLKKVLNIKKS